MSRRDSGHGGAVVGDRRRLAPDTWGVPPLPVRSGGYALPDAAAPRLDRLTLNQVHTRPRWLGVVDHPPQYAALVEVGLWVGLRPGELFGLYGDRVGWLRHEVEVTRVATRAGLREYPKTAKSHRVAPVPHELTPRLSTLMIGRPRDALVFTGARGGVIDDSDFRHRVRVPAVKAARVHACSPKIMRHTAASWLVMDGVDLYWVQALPGHESFRTTQRYAHLAPGAHDKIRESWLRIARGRTP